jgi:thiol:disulfide interchange protein
MEEHENLASFARQNKRLIRDWVETRIELFKLRIARMISVSAGYLAWIFVTIFIALLVIIFVGVTAGFWLSDITGSTTKGFGIITLTGILLAIILAIFRRPIFINPIVRGFVKRMMTDEKENEQQSD